MEFIGAVIFDVIVIGAIVYVIRLVYFLITGKEPKKKNKKRKKNND